MEFPAVLNPPCLQGVSGGANGGSVPGFRHQMSRARFSPARKDAAHD